MRWGVIGAATIKRFVGAEEAGWDRPGSFSCNHFEVAAAWRFFIGPVFEKANCEGFVDLSKTHMRLVVVIHAGIDLSHSFAKSLLAFLAIDSAGIIDWLRFV